jgi:hypothetical protein
VIPSKNTIERRVLIFTRNFSLRRINSFLPEKLQHFCFLNILPRKAKALRKVAAIIVIKVIYNLALCVSVAIKREPNILLE